MARILKPKAKGNKEDETICKRYMKPEVAAAFFDMDENLLMAHARAAGAVYQLDRITLICRERLEVHMKHYTRAKGSAKLIQRKYVRIGEGSIIYNIGRHRFTEMARAAGAVYKLDGGSVLVRLDIFDEYMERFREAPKPMKQPLYRQEGGV